MVVEAETHQAFEHTLAGAAGRIVPPCHGLPQVTRQVQGILIAAPVNYPIGMVVDSHNSAAATTETQVLSLWGHRHAWTTRFHAWVVRADGTEELVYDSTDWYDMPTQRGEEP